MYKLFIFNIDDNFSNLDDGKSSDVAESSEKGSFSDLENILGTIQVRKILMTQGSIFQNKLIDTKILKDLLSEIVNLGSDEEELAFLEKIKEGCVDPHEIVVVGGRRDTSIKYGNIQGFITVLVPGLKYKGILPKEDLEVPSFEVSSFSEVLNVLI